MYNTLSLAIDVLYFNGTNVGIACWLQVFLTVVRDALVEHNGANASAVCATDNEAIDATQILSTLRGDTTVVCACDVFLNSTIMDDVSNPAFKLDPNKCLAPLSK